MQLRGTCAAHAERDARFPKSALGRMRTFVEISIRHNGFHVGSFRFASSRYIRFALPKNRLTGSNPMRESRYFPPPTTLFLRLFFPGRAGAPIKVHVGEEFREANRGKESRCELFAYDFDRARARCPSFLFTSRFFRVSSLSDTRHQILSYSTRIYIHVSKSDNDVATTNSRFIGGSSDIYICKFCKDISIFHPAREQRFFYSAGFLLFFIV